MSDDLYRALFTSMQEALIVAELIERPDTPIDFRYLDANPAAERMLGLRRDQIVGRTSRELIPNIQEDLVELCVRVVRTGVSESRDVFEPLVQQHHQTVFFRPAEGQVALVFTDVTARKRTEEVLEATAASLDYERGRLQLLVSSIGDHLVSYDREWRFTFVNDAAADVLGLPPERLLGQSIWALFPDAVGNAYYRDLHTAVRDNRVVRSEHYYEPFARWFENHIYPSADGVTVFASDITARKRAEAKLRESEERFRVMADSVAVMVWVHAADGTQEFLNTRGCAFFGVSRDSARALEWDGYLHPDERDEYVDAFRSALVQRRPFHAVARMRRADGEWRWIESWGGPRLDGGGEYTGLVGASVDVTDRLIVEQQLRDADRRKNEFLATLAHELRNPLAAINSAVHVLKASGVQAGAANAAVRILDRQVAHMVRQVDDLLDVSRASRGRIELRREPTDLAEVARQAIEAMQVRAPGTSVTVVMPERPIHVDGDSTRLGQVVGNLLSNAVKFGRPDGHIRLEIREEPGVAVLEVCDEGIGIPADQLDRVFDMFTQLDGAVDRARTGLGVGLSLVKTLVELHGGTVRASSAGLGTGAAFTVRLPLTARLPSTDAPPLSRTCAARRILVVDDNRDAADMLALLLTDAGHEAGTAYGGHEAVAQVTLWAPDLVLLDIGMPGMSGYETARLLRQRHPALRLVALTGWGEEHDRQRSVDAGFDAHLVKPAGVEQIDALLTQWDMAASRHTASTTRTTRSA